MGSINLAWIIPVLVVAGALLAAVEWGARVIRADEKAHRQAMAAAAAWRDLSTAQQAAWDEEALDRAAAAVPPLPDVDRGDTR